MQKIDWKKLKHNRLFWVLMGTLFISFIIIVWGDNLIDTLKPLSIRLLIGFAFFFIVLSSLLIRQLYFRNYSTDEMLENAHLRSIEVANASAVSNRVNVLKQQFSHALNLLKKSSLYKSKRDAHYELPWYLVMGGGKEGKTALIESSGLDFPLDHALQLHDIHDDKSFQWYFSDDAILIDIDSRFLKYEPASIDAGVWKAFLDLFKRKRWKRPINGIILTISAETLSNQSQSELEQYAKELRDRFDELTVAFTSTIPIYLFITKSDHITGFQEYFSTLNANEKDEIFGITFDDDNVIEKSIVEKEFVTMRERVDGSVLERIHAQWESADRTKVLLFSDELSNICHQLSAFIETGFAPTRYRAPLMLRGIYFTSVNPSVEISKISNGFDHRGCFISKALKNVVFAEAGMIKMDTTQKFKAKLRERIVIISSIAGILILLALWGWDFTTHKNRVNLTQEQLKMLIATENNNRFSTFEDSLEYLSKLEELRAQTYQESAGIWRLAFFKTSDRQEKIDALYFDALEKHLLPIVASSLEQQIHRDINNYSATWENTKAYLMLSLKEKRNPDFMTQWLATLWKIQYSDNIDVQKNLNHHWANILERDFKSYEINNHTVQIARTALAGIGQDALLYKQLKDKALEMKLPNRSFNLAMGENHTLFTGGDQQINGFFTYKGYQKVFSIDGKTLLKQIIKSNWVLGYTTQIKDSDLDALYIKIQHYYFDEYKKTWNSALYTLALAPNLSDEQISILTSQDSPIVSILKELKTNTDIHSLSELVENKASATLKTQGIETPSLVGDTTAKSVRDYFKPFNDLLTQDNLAGTTLQAEMTRYANASNQASSMNESRTPADAFSAVVAKANGGGGGSVEVSALPSPVSQWLPRAVGMSTAQLIGDAKKHIQEQYAMLLYPFYKSKIENRYPFNPNASSEVALVDFETFFGPGGMLEEFQREYISPLTTPNPNGKGFKSKSFGGSSVPFSPQLMASLYQASEIKRSLFSGRGLGSSIYIRPNTLSKHLGSMNFQYDDTSILYEHGPIKSKKILWPSATGNMEARLNMSDLNDQNVVTTSSNGQWSLFRFFGKMDLVPLGNEEFNAEFTSGANKGSFVLTGPAAKTFGAHSPLRKFTLPGKI